MAKRGVSGPEGRLRVAASVARGRIDDWAVTVKACLDGLGPVPSSGLGVVYISDGLARHASSIVALLRRLTGLADWIGGSSAVVMAVGPAGTESLIDTEGAQPGLAVMILAFPVDASRPIRLPTALASSDPSLDPMAEDWIRHTRIGGAIFHAESRNPAALAAVTGLSRRLGAASVGAALDGRPQICGAVTEGGATGVLFGSSARAVVGIAQGCEPVGPVRRVGAMLDDAVLTLDGEPARAAFHHDIGDLLARDPSRTDGFVFAGLIRAGRAGAMSGETTASDVPDPVIEPGDYEIVAILDPAASGDGIRLGVGASSRPEPGDGVVFVRRDQTQALAALDRMVDRLIRQVGRDHIRGGHFITAADRAATLFGDPLVEFTRVANRLGPVPLIGLQCEAPIVGETLYNRSAVLTLWADRE